MRGIRFTAVVLTGAAILSAGCLFGPQPSRGVLSYRDGRVYIAYHPDCFYRVGILPEGWERLKTRARAAAFYNARYESTIGTDAFCDRSAGDKPLDALAGEVAGALSDRRVLHEREFLLGGRGALRRQVSGTLDGVPFVMDLVVVKKNSCVFDLYAISPPDADPSVATDFEAFLDGFQYE